MLRLVCDTAALRCRQRAEKAGTERTDVRCDNLFEEFRIREGRSGLRGI